MVDQRHLFVGNFKGEADMNIQKAVMDTRLDTPVNCMSQPTNNNEDVVSEETIDCMSQLNNQQVIDKTRLVNIMSQPKEHSTINTAEVNHSKQVDTPKKGTELFDNDLYKKMKERNVALKLERTPLKKDNIGRSKIKAISKIFEQNTSQKSIGLKRLERTPNLKENNKKEKKHSTPASSKKKPKYRRKKRDLVEYHQLSLMDLWSEKKNEF